MAKIIIDRFTNKRISPQLRRRYRLRARGLCVICGQAVVPGLTECQVHIDKAKERRARYKVQAVQKA